MRVLARLRGPAPCCCQARSSAEEAGGGGAAATLRPWSPQGWWEHSLPLGCPPPCGGLCVLMER